MESRRPKNKEHPLQLALGGLGVWIRRSPAAWLGAVGLASIWPLLDHATDLGLLPKTPPGTGFGALAGIGSLIGTTAGLAVLSASPTAAWLMSRTGRWRAEAWTLGLASAGGALLAGLLPVLELGGPLLPVLGLVLTHTFLGLFVHRTWPLASRAPMAFLGLAWLLPALAPAAAQPTLALLALLPHELSRLPALLPLAIAAGWLLLSTHPNPAAPGAHAGPPPPNP